MNLKERQSKIEIVYNLASKLENKSLNQVLKDNNYKNNIKDKGKFGKVLEEGYFNIKNNNRAEPDFKELNLELKTTPLKVVRNNKIVPKERLVLNMINYKTISNENWETSSFLSKNEHLLIIFYLYDKNKQMLDYIMTNIMLYDIEPPDEIIIKQDWNKIVNKIKSGRANELSEGDTFYLGACRKGHHEGNILYSPEYPAAKQRAFCFKRQYMDFLINKNNFENDKIVKNYPELENNNLEDIIINKFKPYFNNNYSELKNIFNLNIKENCKHKLNIICKRILGVKTNKIEEFEKSGIKLKTIRLNTKDLPKESMSFKSFEFEDLLNQNWDDSDFEKDIEKRFFFVIFKIQKDKSVTLQNTFFWTMPLKDRLEVKRIWLKTKKIVQEGIKLETKNNITYNNLPKVKESYVTHVRPHGRNKDDVSILPDGSKLTRQCFWLNKKYIKDIISENS